MYANYDLLVCYVLIACYVVCVIHWISCILCVDQLHVNQLHELAHLRLRLPERPRPFPPLRPLDRDRERFLAPPTAGILFVCGILT